MAVNKSAAVDPATLRLELVRIFVQIPNFVELPINKQEDIIEFYYNYIMEGKSAE